MLRFLIAISFIALLCSFGIFVYEGDNYGYESDVIKKVQTRLRQRLQPEFGVNEANLTTMHCTHMGDGEWVVEGYIDWPILTENPETGGYLRNKGKYTVYVKYGGKIEYDWGEADIYTVTDIKIIFDVEDKK